MSMMQEKMYMDVDDVCAILGVSKTYAYSLMREYNKELKENPCRKAGAIGKSKGEPKDFWMQEEFNALLETVVISQKQEWHFFCCTGPECVSVNCLPLLIMTSILKRRPYQSINLIRD